MSQKSKAEIQEFIAKNRCNPDFWLDALKTTICTTDCHRKTTVLENCHKHLEIFINFLTEKTNEKPIDDN